MVIADLKEPCSACEGSGFQAGIKQYGSHLANDTRKCVVCLGKGYLLTKLGQDIWHLLKPLIEEMMQDKQREKTHSRETEKRGKSQGKS